MVFELEFAFFQIAQYVFVMHGLYPIAVDSGVPFAVWRSDVAVEQ